MSPACLVAISGDERIRDLLISLLAQRGRGSLDKAKLLRDLEYMGVNRNRRRAVHREEGNTVCYFTPHTFQLSEL